MKVEVIGKQPVNPEACEPAPELEAVQGLMPMSSEDRQRLRESIESEGVRDPVRAYRVKGPKPYKILSGFNRWSIALEIGLDTIPLEIIETEDREGYAIEDNLARRHLTTEQKRALVVYLLKQDPTQSDRQAGKKAGVSKNTAASVRKELQARGQIDHVEKKDTQGRKVGQKPVQKSGKKAETEPTKKPEKVNRSQHSEPDSKPKPKTKAEQVRALKAELKATEQEIKKLQAIAKHLKKKIANVQSL